MKTSKTSMITWRVRIRVQTQNLPLYPITDLPDITGQLRNTPEP